MRAIVHKEIYQAFDAQEIINLYHERENSEPVSYTHLRAHETVLDLVCRLLLEKTKTKKQKRNNKRTIIIQ